MKKTAFIVFMFGFQFQALANISYDLGREGETWGEEHSAEEQPGEEASGILIRHNNDIYYDPDLSPNRDRRRQREDSRQSGDGRQSGGGALFCSTPTGNCAFPAGILKSVGSSCYCRRILRNPMCPVFTNCDIWGFCYNTPMFCSLPVIHQIDYGIAY